MATATAVTVRPRHCVRCGKNEEQTAFRSPQAMKCMVCDDLTEEERREYHRTYHKARAIAVRNLVKAHNTEYERMLVKARKQVEREEEAASVRAQRSTSAA